MIFIIFVTIIVLWVLGGQLKGRIRDIGVPILIGLGIWLVTKSWLVGLINMATWNIIRLGYGNYEEGEKNSFLAELLKDKEGWYVRMAYGLIVATIAPLPLFIGHFLALGWYFVYIIGNSLIGYGVSRLRLPVLLTDILVSAGFSSILFLIK